MTNLLIFLFLTLFSARIRNCLTNYDADLPETIDATLLSTSGFNCSQDTGFLVVSSMQLARPFVCIRHVQSAFYRRNFSPVFGIPGICHRHSSSLQWLLIVAGDIELNPGPIREHESGDSPPAKRLNIRYGCLCGKDNELDTNFYCERCNHSYHEACLAKLLSASEVLGLDRDSFECSYCKMLESERFHDVSLQQMNMHQAELLREIKELRIELCTKARRYDVLRLQQSQTPEPNPLEPPHVFPKKVRIVKGLFDALSNFYSFTFVFRGVIFDCTEKAFQYFKALKANRIDLCRAIQTAPTAVAAKRYGNQIPQETHDVEFEYNLMSEILLEKSKQCKSFRDELRASTGSAIMHSTYQGVDKFWATGLNFWDLDSHYKRIEGFNIFGKQLEWVRSQLLNESEYQSTIETVVRDGCVHILHDGENPLPERRTQRQYRGAARQNGRRCYYCEKIGHIARNCFLKNADERKCDPYDVDNTRDPIVRFRMRRWLQFKSNGTAPGARTFHSRRFSHSQNATLLQSKAPVNMEAACSSNTRQTVDYLLGDCMEEDIGAAPGDNQSVSSSSCTITVGSSGD
jgi:ribA/ribD-fused uncharacterized protein